MSDPASEKDLSPEEKNPLTNPAFFGAVAVVAAATIAAIATGMAARWTADVSFKDSINKRLSEATKKVESRNAEEKNTGILDLEGILKDAPDKQWQILRTLESLIQNNSPVPKKLNVKIENRKNILPYVQTALTVIKSRTIENDNLGREERGDRRIIKLKEINLFRADLQKAQLPGADFSRSDLTNAVLEGANLQGAFLRGTYLRGAGLEGANLAGADLQKADFFGAALGGANLDGANLSGTNLTGSKGITNEQIKKACNWEQAKYDNDRSEELKQEDTNESETRPECKIFVSAK
jgi:Pentapeptide repeats (8 copies)